MPEFGGRLRIIVQGRCQKYMFVDVLPMEAWEISKCNQGDQGKSEELDVLE